ncbi:VOC family protein [Mycolicibacterium sp. CBMA 226]|uniref:VOC family protein n=1 Tax=Mycolicibacterium sp. CBMA 226 TaxID=2606611 RepID=UPI0012DEB8C8|nr:VOC family protein [Mycolicibacterium sp. CBMA 226]MUL77383.1 glyoxalase [Mycolicibacterium sp. CBMA 226]
MHNSHDPLTVLAGGEQPVQPDPAFADRLRARLEAAVTLPKGVVMSGTDTAIADLNAPAVVAVEAPRPAALPYLAVTDARAAITWYVDALGAVVVGDPIVMDDGRIGHAELALAGGVLYLADEFPELGLKAPAPQSVSVSLMLNVPDTDAALAQARQHGAQVQREPYEAHDSRTAVVIDPFGHRWMLTGPISGAAIPIRHGDIGYVSVQTPDAERAAAFYAHVLGWVYDPGTHKVTGNRLHTGIFETTGPQTLFCCYAVRDLDTARQAILAAGGQVGTPEVHEWGATLEATDALGTDFAVFQPVPGIVRPELNGAGPGELSYLTYAVTDSAAFKQFYGGVLSWTFEPGRIDDGWGVQECHPMSGVAGGSAHTVAVPMWTVTDIDAAVARVREAGGSVIEAPSRQPYGMMALCTDDQGARFYLGAF